MDGFTISSSNRFLETGKFETGKIDGGKSSGMGDSGEVKGQSFSETLKMAIGSVNELQKTSDVAMQNLATGRTDNVADVMVAAEKADIALKLMMQVRNKIIDAYQDIMKMQV